VQGTWLLDAEVGEGASLVHRRVYLDAHDGQVVLVTFVPPVTRIVTGRITGDSFEAQERGSPRGSDRIVVEARRDGDALEGRWQQGATSVRLRASLASEPAFAVENGETRWAGLVGRSDRVRARIMVHPGGVLDGALLHLDGNKDRALSGTVDARGHLHLDESSDGAPGAAWEGVFVDPATAAGRRTIGDGPPELFTLRFAPQYPEPITLWDDVALRPEVHHVEASRDCWSDTTMPHVTGLADAVQQEKLNVALGRWFGVRALLDPACTSGQDRWYTVTWKKRPFAQVTREQSVSEDDAGGAGRCRILDLEHGRLVDPHELIRDRNKLERFLTVASKSVRCLCQADPPGCGCPDVRVSPDATMCLSDDAVTVEDEGLPATEVPRSRFAELFDTTSALGQGIFARPSMSATSTPRAVVRGEGRCTSDDQCVVATVVDPCCGFASCEPRPMSQALHEQRQRARCAHPGGYCPSPAPCPPGSRRSWTPVCSDHVCSAVVQDGPPPIP
jgi:hypothetical protein